MINANIGIRMHDTIRASMEEQAAFIRGQGFSCVHLALSKVLDARYMDPAAATPGLCAHVKHALGGLDIAVLGCYLNLAHPDPLEYRAILDRYTAHLKMAVWLGAGCVGTETGNPNAAYAYDPERSHTDEALELFIRRLVPVVETAEKIGATLAIEPVYTHIVSTPARARRVLDALSSPSLRIILDPVNLLHPDNLDRREELIEEALGLLEKEIIVLHIKDYQFREGRILGVPLGTGEMDYTRIAGFVKEKKPYIQMTLEDTKPDNARAGRDFVARVFEQ